MPGQVSKAPAPHTAQAVLLVGAMTEMVGRSGYPCLGARSVFRRDRATFCVYDELDAAATAPLLLQDLQKFAAAVNLDEGLASFVATFRGPRIIDERHFERLLWSQLRRLHALDAAPWSDEVSPDPDDEHFAFSVAGSAYFLVGLHPMSSRDARRAASPPWSSTSTSSSWRCGRRDTTRGCATASVSGTSSCRAASTPWSRTKVRSPRPGSTPAGTSGPAPDGHGFRVVGRTDSHRRRPNGRPGERPLRLLRPSPR